MHSSVRCQQSNLQKSNMFAKIVAFVAFLAVAAAQGGDKYPAGVNPASCPNYPLCDPYVNANPQPQYQPQYNPAPQYYSAPAPQPQYNYNPAPAPLAAPVAAQYPAGVSPASCPNYPYCNNGASAAPAPPLPGFTARLYPDGVNPSVCPNYPYCS